MHLFYWPMSNCGSAYDVSKSFPDDYLKSKLAVPAGSLKSKPTRLNTNKGVLSRRLFSFASRRDEVHEDYDCNVTFQFNL